MPWLKCPFAVGTLGREMTVRRVSACPRAVKVIADHATARHTSQMSTDFSFTLPPPVVSVSCFSKLRHCLTKGERLRTSTVGSGTPAVEYLWPFWESTRPELFYLCRREISSF